MTLKERVKQLRAIEAQLPEKLKQAATGAAIRAVEKAAELTPPKTGDLRGTNTRSGEMKQHWATDSKPVANRRGNQYVSLLANNKQYASYVDQGHRMDRHFVPGLVINEASGMLEFVSEGYVDAMGVSHLPGIVVGTRTAYVKGLFMVDAAKEEYKRVLRQELADIGDIIE